MWTRFSAIVTAIYAVWALLLFWEAHNEFLVSIAEIVLLLAISHIWWSGAIGRGSRFAIVASFALFAPVFLLNVACLGYIVLLELAFGAGLRELFRELFLQGDQDSLLFWSQVIMVAVHACAMGVLAKTLAAENRYRKQVPGPGA